MNENEIRRGGAIVIDVDDEDNIILPEQEARIPEIYHLRADAMQKTKAIVILINNEKAKMDIKARALGEKSLSSTFVDNIVRHIFQTFNLTILSDENLVLGRNSALWNWFCAQLYLPYNNINITQGLKYMKRHITDTIKMVKWQSGEEYGGITTHEGVMEKLREHARVKGYIRSNYDYDASFDGFIILLEHYEWLMNEDLLALNDVLRDMANNIIQIAKSTEIVNKEDAILNLVTEWKTANGQLQRLPLHHAIDLLQYDKFWKTILLLLGKPILQTAGIDDYGVMLGMKFAERIANSANCAKFALTSGKDDELFTSNFIAIFTLILEQIKLKVSGIGLIQPEIDSNGKTDDPRHNFIRNGGLNFMLFYLLHKPLINDAKMGADEKKRLTDLFTPSVVIALETELNERDKRYIQQYGKENLVQVSDGKQQCHINNNDNDDDDDNNNNNNMEVGVEPIIQHALGSLLDISTEMDYSYYTNFIVEIKGDDDDDGISSRLIVDIYTLKGTDNMIHVKVYTDSIRSSIGYDNEEGYDEQEKKRRLQKSQPIIGKGKTFDAMFQIDGDVVEVFKWFDYLQQRKLIFLVKYSDAQAFDSRMDLFVIDLDSIKVEKISTTTTTTTTGLKWYNIESLKLQQTDLIRLRPNQQFPMVLNILSGDGDGSTSSDLEMLIIHIRDAKEPKIERVSLPFPTEVKIKYVTHKKGSFTHLAHTIFQSLESIALIVIIRLNNTNGSVYALHLTYNKHSATGWRRAQNSLSYTELMNVSDKSITIRNLKVNFIYESIFFLTYRMNDEYKRSVLLYKKHGSFDNLQKYEEKFSVFDTKRVMPIFQRLLTQYGYQLAYYGGGDVSDHVNFNFVFLKDDENSDSDSAKLNIVFIKLNGLSQSMINGTIDGLKIDDIKLLSALHEKPDHYGNQPLLVIKTENNAVKRVYLRTGNNFKKIDDLENLIFKAFARKMQLSSGGGRSSSSSSNGFNKTKSPLLNCLQCGKITSLCNPTNGRPYCSPFCIEMFTCTTPMYFAK
jgi:hypothetical protein